MKCVGGGGGGGGRRVGGASVVVVRGHKIKNRGCFVDSNSKLYGDHLLLLLGGLKEQQSVCVCVCLCWECACVCVPVCARAVV